jgi:hypothetical protein
MGYNIPAPCTAVLLSDSDKLLTCTRQNAELALVRINNLPSSKNFLNIIALRDIPNPAATVGTGIFSLRVLKGTENEFDFNYFFDQVAFSPAALVIPAATLVIVANDEPNLFANYKMDITFAVGTIPAGGKIRLKIPESLTFDKSTLAITPTPSLGPGVVTSFYRDFVILSNLIGQTIPTLSLLIQNIKNFPYAGGTPDFVFQLRADGTETLLEQATVAGPTISPTMLPNANVIFSSFEVDLSQSTLYQTDVVEYELKFKIKNAVPSNGGINIDYPASFTVTRCWGISNVIDISESTLATCTIAANRMRISNIRGIAKDKFVRVGFRAVNPPSALATEPFSPFTIGTYYDSLFLKNIDLSLGQTVNILGINSPSIVTFPTASCLQYRTSPVRGTVHHAPGCG